MTSEEWLSMRDNLQLSDPTMDCNLRMTSDEYLNNQLAIANAKIETLEAVTEQAVDEVEAIISKEVKDTNERTNEPKQPANERDTPLPSAIIQGTRETRAIRDEGRPAKSFMH